MGFEEFVKTRLAVLLRYAAVLTGDRELAQDVVQDVLVKAHARWSRISGMDGPEAYLKRMIVNDYLSWRRRWATRHTVLTGDVAAFGDVESPARSEDPSASQLWTRLGSLPRRQRAVLVLRYYEGLTDPEIATVLHCAPGTVRGYHSRALATLRIELAHHTAIEELL